ncbi:MAG: sulfite exporter TauE/SafE family protein [Saprospiraceae bacterium]
MDSFLFISYQLSALDWLMAFTAAFVLGVSKSGVKGIALIVVTLLALVFGGKASTGVLMPMLIMGDVFAVLYYRRHTQWNYLWRLLPWMIAGVLFGVWFGQDLPELLFKRMMASVILLTVFLMYWWGKRKSKAVPHGWWFSGTMGLAAGFTTMIGNLAGAFSNLYFLAMRLPKNEFIGTAAWLFFIINLFKLPFHIFVWETVHWESFKVNLVLMPALALGLWTGTHIVRRIQDDFYRQLILVLTACGAVLILVR